MIYNITVCINKIMISYIKYVTRKTFRIKSAPASIKLSRTQFTLGLAERRAKRNKKFATRSRARAREREPLILDSRRYIYISCKQGFLQRAQQ